MASSFPQARHGVPAPIKQKRNRKASAGSMRSILTSGPVPNVNGVRGVAARRHFDAERCVKTRNGGYRLTVIHASAVRRRGRSGEKGPV